MNWRYRIARIKYLLNIPYRIREAERERCIRVLTNNDLGIVTASLTNGRLDENWLRSLLQPYIPETK